MPKHSNEVIIFQGKVYNRDLVESFKFPVGCKFHYSNASYNDNFTVASIRKDPGAEFRQIIGAIAGEVWMLLSTLQREAADGSVHFLEEKKAAPKEAKVTKKKTKKVAKKKK